MTQLNLLNTQPQHEYMDCQHLYLAVPMLIIIHIEHQQQIVKIIL